MIIKDLASLAQPIESLKSLEGNPRRGAVDSIAASLTRFGQRKPLTARTSDRVVIAGNHTLAAAISLGWSEVAVVFVDDDESESLAFALADNRLSDLGSYDDTDLFTLLGTLDDFVGTGYDLQDFADLLTLSDAGSVTSDEMESYFKRDSLRSDGVLADNSLAALHDSYSDKVVRSIILSYALEEFQEVTNLLANARHSFGCDSNAEVLLRYLRQS